MTSVGNSFYKSNLIITHWSLKMWMQCKKKCNFQPSFTDYVIKSSNNHALRWMPKYYTDDKSTLVQVIACCLKATSHYLGQCRPRSILPSVNVSSIGPRSLSDKNWEGLTGCPCLSMLNHGKNQHRSDKTVILNALTVQYVSLGHNELMNFILFWLSGSGICHPHGDPSVLSAPIGAGRGPEDGPLWGTRISTTDTDRREYSHWGRDGARYWEWTGGMYRQASHIQLPDGLGQVKIRPACRFRNFFFYKFYVIRQIKIFG